METVVKKLYEAMFLVDSGLAASDWDGVLSEIKRILDRSEAEIVALKKWDERLLAYEVNRKFRGTYILCYFRADGQRIGAIERDVQLSEQIMRVLILCADHMSQEEIDKDTPSMAAERRAEKKSTETTEVPKQEVVAEEAEAVEEESTAEETEQENPTESKEESASSDNVDEVQETEMPEQEEDKASEA